MLSQHFADIAIVIISFILGIVAHAVRMAYVFGQKESKYLTADEAERRFALKHEAIMKEANGNRQLVRFGDLKEYCSHHQDQIMNSIIPRLEQIEARLLNIEQALLSRDHE